MERIKSFKDKSFIIFLILLLGFVVIWAASVGAVSIPFKTTARIFLSRVFGLSFLFGKASWSETYEIILLKIRFPRVILAVLVGAALSVSGVIFQGIFKNPMADPYIIGVSSGAALGATLAFVAFSGFGVFGFSLIPILAFVGAVLTTLLVYNLARVGSRVSVSTLLLSGIAVGSFLAALTAFLMIFGTKDLHQIFLWLMGSFSAKNWDHVKVMFPFVIFGLPLAFFYSRELNVLLLGEERAQHLGVDTERLKRTLIIAASLLAASAVAVSGIIGFVGLIIPHMVRLITGPSHKKLILASTLFGASFMVVADLLSRTLMAPLEIPIGIITSLFGAPFFMYLLKRSKKKIF